MGEEEGWVVHEVAAGKHRSLKDSAERKVYSKLYWKEVPVRRRVEFEFPREPELVPSYLLRALGGAHVRPIKINRDVEEACKPECEREIDAKCPSRPQALANEGDWTMPSEQGLQDVNAGTTRRGMLFWP